MYFEDVSFGLEEYADTNIYSFLQQTINSPLAYFETIPPFDPEPDNHIALEFYHNYYVDAGTLPKIIEHLTEIENPEDFWPLINGHLHVTDSLTLMRALRSRFNSKPNKNLNEEKTKQF